MVQNYCSYQKSGLQACLEVQTTNNRTKQNSKKTNKTEKTKAVHEQYKYSGSTVVSEILDILHAESHIILHPLSLFCQNSKFKNLLPNFPASPIIKLRNPSALWYITLGMLLVLVRTTSYPLQRASGG